MNKILLSKIFLLALLIVGFSHVVKAQKDTIPPTIVITDSDTDCIQLGSVWVFKDPLITDNQSDKDNITFKMTWQGNGVVNTNVRGTYPVLLEATDSNGNKTKRIVNYKVDDCIPPTIDLNSADTVCHKLGTPYNPVQPKAADNYYPASQVALVRLSTSVNANIKGIYTEVYEATDASGNKTTKNRYVIVSDTCAALSVNAVALIRLEIYPNPAQTYIYVSLMNSGPLDNGLITIIAMDGKKVFESPYANSQIQIQTDAFPNGIYVVNVVNGGRLVNRKIVVLH